MKTNKQYRLLIGGILFAIIGLITSCSVDTKLKSSNEPPKVSIISNNIDIPYVIGKNIWNGAIYDREDNLQVIMKDNTEETLKYIPIGQGIEIVFEGVNPDSVELVDQVIDNSGNEMFTNSSKIISINFENGKCSFNLDDHYATLLSSNSETFEKGVLRGFRLTCKWGENECEYSFVIKTN